MKIRSTKNYIAIEGIDGSGKGTQVQLTVKHLQQKSNHRVELFEELTESTSLGQKIRKELKSNQFFNPTRHDLFMVHLFLTNRIERTYGPRGIQELLSQNNILIQDRSLLSTFAYAQDISFEVLWELHKNLIFPNIIYLDIDVPEALNRIKKRTEELNLNPEKYENIEKLYKIKEKYNNTIDQFRSMGINIIKIDANNKDIIQVQEEIQEQIRKYI